MLQDRNSPIIGSFISDHLLMGLSNLAGPQQIGRPILSLRTERQGGATLIARVNTPNRFLLQIESGTLNVLFNGVIWGI